MASVTQTFLVLRLGEMSLDKFVGKFERLLLGKDDLTHIFNQGEVGGLKYMILEQNFPKANSEIMEIQKKENLYPISLRRVLRSPVSLKMV